MSTKIRGCLHNYFQVVQDLMVIDDEYYFKLLLCDDNILRIEGYIKLDGIDSPFQNCSFCSYLPKNTKVSKIINLNMTSSFNSPHKISFEIIEDSNNVKYAWVKDEASIC